MPKRSSLIYWSLFLTILLAGLHFLAQDHFLYWTYWWYDWMMHFLAGLAGGMAAYWGIFHSGVWRRKTDAILLPMLAVLLCLMTVGIAWEFFEYANGITDSHEELYALDVTHDLIMDALGAILAVLIGLKMTLLRHSSNPSL